MGHVMWVVVFFLLLSTTTEVKASHAPLGAVTGIHSHASAVHGTGADAVPLNEGDPIFVSSRYQTDPDSKMRFLLEDDSIFTLGEKTIFQLEEGSGVGDVFYGALTQGIVRARVGPGFSHPGSRFVIQTPAGSVFGETEEGYLIVWTTECDGKPAMGILSLAGQVTARQKGVLEGVTLSPLVYTKMGETCPPPLPRAVSNDMLAEVTAATEMIDPVAAVAMEIEEPVDPRLEGPLVGTPLIPTGVQTPKLDPQLPELSRISRVRVHIIFP